MSNAAEFLSASLDASQTVRCSMKLYKRCASGQLGSMMKHVIRLGRLRLALFKARDLSK